MFAGPGSVADVVQYERSEYEMRNMRMRLSAAVLIALLALSVVGGAANAQHGGDDPCPHHVENLPGCG
jgi:hypothetical protein